MSELRLRRLPGAYAVCRSSAGAAAPTGSATGSSLWSLTRTADETSLVCPESEAPPGWRVEPGWRALAVVGPLDFSLVGVLSELAGRLADAGVSLFALSTFDTDYLLVRTEALDTAVAALRRAGHEVDT